MTQNVPEADIKLETVDFSKVEDSWFAYFLVESKEAADKIISDPKFKPSELKVSIQVNGVNILVEDFDRILSTITAKMLEERIVKEGWKAIDISAKKKAEDFYRSLHSDLYEKAQEAMSNLDQLSEQAHTIVETHWENFWKQRT